MGEDKLRPCLWSWAGCGAVDSDSQYIRNGPFDTQCKAWKVVSVGGAVFYLQLLFLLVAHHHC